MSDNILVTSHVSRDFLQSAAVFNTLPKVVWEYVSNSLDNPNDNNFVGVVVNIMDNRIEIIDNGRGMNRTELNNFFQMHGENLNRKKGKRVRGRFGTGKSAAFGIANTLTIDSVSNKIKNIVSLSRSNIESAKDGDPFRVENVLKNEPSNLENGVVIAIEDINIKVKGKIPSVISYIEKHLGRYRQKASVTINGHPCEYKELNFSETFEKSPPDKLKEEIGEIKLIIKTSPTPLGEEEKGIDIMSRGIWHQTTLAGIEKKEFSNYLFGEVDVPIFEDKEDWKIPPFDNTRNSMLNKSNPLVIKLLSWISFELEEVRKYLVSQDKKRRDSLEAKKLKKEAKEIARILNEDFSKVIDDFELAAKLSAKSGRTKISPDPSSIFTNLPGEGEEDTGFQQSGHEHGDGNQTNINPGPGDVPREGPDIIDGDQTGSKKPASNKGKKRKRGIFSLEYLHETPESNRSRYDSETRTIIVNLDHPQISNIFLSNSKNLESKIFRDVSYEVAAVEYALALPFEKMKIDNLYDAADALYDTREIINRVTRKFAEIA
jgi:hypothetical protein